MITNRQHLNRSAEIARAYARLSRSVADAPSGSNEYAGSSAAETFVELKFPADQWPALYALVALENAAWRGCSQEEFDPDPEVTPWLSHFHRDREAAMPWSR